MSFKKKYAIKPLFLLIPLLLILNACGSSGKSTASNGGGKSSGSSGSTFSIISVPEISSSGAAADGQTGNSQDGTAGSTGSASGNIYSVNPTAPVTYTEETLRTLLHAAVAQGLTSPTLTISDGAAHSDEITRILSNSLVDDYAVGLFVSSMSYSLRTTGETAYVDITMSFNERQPEYASYLAGGDYYYGSYSYDSLEKVFLNAVLSYAPSFTAVFSLDDPSASVYQDDLGTIRANNEYIQYYLGETSGYTWPFTNGIMLSITLSYNPDAVPMSSIVYMDGLNEKEILQQLLLSPPDYKTPYVMHLAAGDKDTPVSTAIVTSCVNALADKAAHPATYSYITYAGENGSIYIALFDYLSTEEIRAARDAAVTPSLDAAVSYISSATEGKSDREKCRFIVDYLCDLTEYDYDLANAMMVIQSWSDEQDFERYAYGPFVLGKTVCSGYAAAFKTIADRIGIPAWIVDGTVYSNETGRMEAHAWNAVLLDDAVYYIDVTFTDAGYYDKYFLFTDYSLDNRTAEDGWILPW